MKNRTVKFNFQDGSKATGVVLNEITGQFGGLLLVKGFVNTYIVEEAYTTGYNNAGHFIKPENVAAVTKAFENSDADEIRHMIMVVR